MKTFKFNEKEYKVPEMDFNALCELGDLGLDFTQMTTENINGLKVIRGLLSYAINENPEITGKLITQELSNIGIEKFTENLKPLLEELNDSVFFKQLAK